MLAEGILRKIRGFARNRSRWFRLTRAFFAFYTADGGSLIAHVPRASVQEVQDIDARRFLVRTAVPFGISGSNSMLLEARTPEVGAGWVLAVGGGGWTRPLARPLSPTRSIPSAVACDSCRVLSSFPFPVSQSLTLPPPPHPPRSSAGGSCRSPRTPRTTRTACTATLAASTPRATSPSCSPLAA